MISLSDFAIKVRSKNRISFGDVQRLQRNVIPDGIGSLRMPNSSSSWIGRWPAPTARGSGGS